MKAEHNRVSKKAIQLFLGGFSGILIISALLMIFLGDADENHDLTLIGKGQNVVVQIHDPH
ncbi:MAG: hypothetical protein HQM12_01980 [SAR324 cluster bacterium]|nr:hypothetical protein [SAR324 cluster bacterium]MBF0352154.1 hypothetical protein [SAR324 cluster bacterium]